MVLRRPRQEEGGRGHGQQEGRGRALAGLGPRAALCGPRGHDALGGENLFCLGIRYENTPFL